MNSLVIDHRAMNIAELRPYHRNAKRGDVPKIRESLERTGQYREIVVNVGSRTGRTNEVLAGSHTMRAAQALGWTEIDCSFVDVDDQTAAKINIADNRTADLGTYDNDVLVEQLGDLDDLIGTGWDEESLDLLLTPPEPDAGRAGLTFQVVVDCEDEADQRTLIERLEAEGRTARPS